MGVRRIGGPFSFALVQRLDDLDGGAEQAAIVPVKPTDLRRQDFQPPGFSRFEKVAPPRGRLHAHDTAIMPIPGLLDESCSLKLCQQPRYGRRPNLFCRGKLLDGMRTSEDQHGQCRELWCRKTRSLVALAQPPDQPDRRAMQTLGNGTAIPFPSHMDLFT